MSMKKRLLHWQGKWAEDKGRNSPLSLVIHTAFRPASKKDVRKNEFYPQLRQMAFGGSLLFNRLTVIKQNRYGWFVFGSVYGKIGQNHA